MYMYLPEVLRYQAIMQNLNSAIQNMPAYFYNGHYCMSHRYWANFFSTYYLQLKSIFLSPDSNPMTHEHESCS